MSIWTEIEQKLAALPVEFDLKVEQPNVTVNGETFRIKNPARLLEDVRDLPDRPAFRDLPDRPNVQDILHLLSYF